MVKFAEMSLKKDTYDFKLIDFNYYNGASSFPISNENDDNDTEYSPSLFRIQMFGINELGETCSIIAENFCPFFYAQVPDSWDLAKKTEFIFHIKKQIKPFYHSTINESGCKIIKRRKFYGFDSEREYKFLRLEFTNMIGYNQVKNLWYSSYEQGHKLLKSGYKYKNTYLPLYEANIPAILRFLHINQISPSGWIQIPTKKTTYRGSRQFTSCDYEFCIDHKHIVSLSNKDMVVPYKILSFDIEASSSHGDFPIPKKTYKKLAQNIFEYFEKKTTNTNTTTNTTTNNTTNNTNNTNNTNTTTFKTDNTPLYYKNELQAILLHVFGVELQPRFQGTIETVYPKMSLISTSITFQTIKRWVSKLVNITGTTARKIASQKNTIDHLFEHFETTMDGTNGGTADDDGDVDIDGNESYFMGNDDDDCDYSDNQFHEIDYKLDEDGELIPNIEYDMDNAHTSASASASASISINMVEEVGYEDKINQHITDSAILDILSDIYISKNNSIATGANNTNKKDRVSSINELDKLLKSVLPELEGDKVTFIGSTLLKYGDKDPYMNHCIVLNDCAKMPDVQNGIMETYNTEKEVLLAWSSFIQRENPDIIIGYNIFGFDYEFMFYRADENECLEEFLKLSRNRNEICSSNSGNRALKKHTSGDNETDKEIELFRDYKLSETSLKISSGEYVMKYINMTGRLQIDLYLYFRREFNLSSYKLDSVASNFISDVIQTLIPQEDDTLFNCSCSIITTKNMTGLTIGSYIHIEEVGHTADYYNNGEKFRILNIDYAQNCFIIQGQPTPNFATKIIKWGMAKDDVSPQDIFRMTNGTLEDRAIIAKYCIQDCNLVHYLANKIDIVTDFVEMSQICSVPINFLIMRGQGIKLFSLLSQFCREKRTLIPVIEKVNDGGYEGAIVLPPKCDLYLDKPIAVNDYNSLYPSSMISENISHDSKVWTKEYDLNDNLIRETGEKLENKYAYDNLPNYDYVNITYDTYKFVSDPKRPNGKAKKVKCGYKICRFAQFPNGNKGIIPSILEKLLKARKDTRAIQKTETDTFRKNILEVRQLNYKKCANSVYGQCGATTSSFYDKDVAASTTAIGRLNITYAKRIIEEIYNDTICDTKFGYKVRTNAEYIYGDTDSIFYTFNLKQLDGTPIIGRTALEITFDLAQEVGKLASSFLKQPHNWEYEKTFMPFCLLSKKRYVGILYEEDPNKGKRKEMGIVLKRRDNAPIVKDVYGGIIDILLKKQDIIKAMEFLQTNLKNIADENVQINKLIITKQLRSGYAKPQQIAHKVLADRIGDREPGNRPKPGDRIDFIYIQTPTTELKRAEKVLQGNRIETPAFISANKTKIDYAFYITNQIKKPVVQVFALVLERIWELQNKHPQLRTFLREIENIKNLAKKEKWDNEKMEKKIEDLRIAQIEKLLFEPFLRELNNKKTGNQLITGFFKK